MFYIFVIYIYVFLYNSKWYDIRKIAIKMYKYIFLLFNNKKNYLYGIKCEKCNIIRRIRRNDLIIRSSVIVQRLKKLWTILEKRKRYNLRTTCLPHYEKEQTYIALNSNLHPSFSASPINTPIVTFHRDKRPPNCTTKARSSLESVWKKPVGTPRPLKKKRRKSGEGRRGGGEGEERETKEKTNRRRDKKKENAEKREREKNFHRRRWTSNSRV